MTTALLRAGVALTMLLGMVLAIPALAQPSAPTSVEVASAPNRFDPATVTVEVGDTVEWRWTSGTHTVTSDDGTSFDSMTQSTGATFSNTFDAVGSFPYFCEIHSRAGGSGQNGTVTVVAAGEGELSPTPGVTPTPTPTPPTPQVEGDPTDVDGTDPVATALSWSGLLADGSRTTAFIGTSGTFPDSLASGPGQGILDAPLLLTPTAELDPRVAAELRRLGVSSIFILGGPAAISADTESSLAQIGQVTRLAGPTRLETARAVADQVAPTATTVILARADGEGTAAFADSLGAGALGGGRGWPVVLVGRSLDDGLATWLQARGVTRVIIAGGTAAVPQQVEDQLTGMGITVDRAAGASRTQTAVRLLSETEGATEGPVLIDGFGDLAWASGFAAALQASGRGVLLARATSETIPGDSAASLLIRALAPVCGPTLSAETCRQARLLPQVYVDSDGDPALMAVLDGAQEVPATTTGASAGAELRAVGEATCVVADVQALSGPIVAAHIHQGAFGDDGDVVAPILLASDASGSFATGCSTAEASTSAPDLLSAPAGYYLNIHTAAHSGGEIRGQLFTATDADVGATLDGAQEVPGPGDAAASGTATVFQTGVADELCYRLIHSDLDPAPSAAHIHQGAAGAAGDVVHPLVLGPTQTSYHCDRGVTPALRSAIFDSPSNFYVNVHNTTFPAGAIRGQLSPARS